MQVCEGYFPSMCHVPLSLLFPLDSILSPLRRPLRSALHRIRMCGNVRRRFFAVAVGWWGLISPRLDGRTQGGALPKAPQITWKAKGAYATDYRIIVCSAGNSS